jgi:hypothetical protein
MQILIIILALVRVRIGMSLQWYELEVVRVDDGTAIGKPRMSLLRFLNAGTESAEVATSADT